MPQRFFPRYTNPSQIGLFLLMIVINLASSLLPAYAALQVVTAEGEYRMGDRDTKEDAVRLATEAAKRHALEQVATYVESVTVANGMDLTRDEIRSYTAGVVVVTEQRVTTRIEDDAIVFRVEMTAQLDPNEVIQAIIALRQNDEAQQQVKVLQSEVEQLQQELSQANQKLEAATTPEQIYFANREREELLNRVDSDQMLARAWTGIALGPIVPQPYIQGWWVQAWTLYPANPHLVVFQRTLPVASPITLTPRMIPPAPAPLFRKAPGVFTPRTAAVPPAASLRPLSRLPSTRYLSPSRPVPSVRHSFSIPHGSAPRYGPSRGRGGGGYGRGRR
ncbi:MAG TPA: hypothetical protein VJ692_11895 [Nitrospiraceae bacterium]|nr:hypothetical protein [Nitrospiraceae bacterium]